MNLLYNYRTFAYLTLKDRMPRILTQIIDTVNREEKNVAKEHGEVSSMQTDTTPQWPHSQTGAYEYHYASGWH